MIDRRLFRRSNINARSTFEKLVDEFAPNVYRQAYRMLGSADEAEDVLQDVFLKVYLSLHRFRGDAQASTWIYRIAANVCLSRLRERKKRAARERALPDSDVLANSDPDPLEQTELLDSNERLSRLVARLPAREALAITLFYIEGLDYRETAEVMEIPIGSVASALARGREFLHQMMDQGKRCTHEL